MTLSDLSFPKWAVLVNTHTLNSMCAVKLQPLHLQEADYILELTEKVILDDGASES